MALGMLLALLPANATWIVPMYRPVWVTRCGSWRQAQIWTSPGPTVGENAAPGTDLGENELDVSDLDGGAAHGPDLDEDDVGAWPVETDVAPGTDLNEYDAPGPFWARTALLARLWTRTMLLAPRRINCTPPLPSRRNTALLALCRAAIKLIAAVWAINVPLLASKSGEYSCPSACLGEAPCQNHRL